MQVARHKTQTLLYKREMEGPPAMFVDQRKTGTDIGYPWHTKTARAYSWKILLYFRSRYVATF